MTSLSSAKGQWQLAGYPAIIENLGRNLVAGRIAHAYLATGSAQVGKRRLAIDLAKALNCREPVPPCGACRSCTRIESGLHPDVEVVGVGGVCDDSDHDHARDNSRDIKICQVRRVQRSLALRPFEGLWRVVIIDPADALNIYAADALLKTLEEPPPQVALILLATDVVSLPETIVSRAQEITLSPLPVGTIRDELVAAGVAMERAELIARLSSGRLGWALAHVNDEALLDERSGRLDRIQPMMRAGRAERMRFFSELASTFSTSREETYAWLDLWRGWLRDLLLVSNGCQHLVTNTDRITGLTEDAPAFAVAGIVRAIDALIDCRKRLDANANPRLAMEVLALRLPSPTMALATGR